MDKIEDSVVPENKKKRKKKKLGRSKVQNADR